MQDLVTGTKKRKLSDAGMDTSVTLSTSASSLPSNIATAPGEETGKSRGLRHFSMKVCNKVRSKIRTTYNEVADDLVTDMRRQAQPSAKSFDEKNVRRRVYDALNVLLAMDIIAKEKKDLIWRGLPET